jgi:hypothetical protein
LIEAIAKLQVSVPCHSEGSEEYNNFNKSQILHFVQDDRKTDFTIASSAGTAALGCPLKAGGGVCLYIGRSQQRSHLA